MAVDSVIFLGHIVSYFRKIQNLKAVVFMISSGFFTSISWLFLSQTILDFSVFVWAILPISFISIIGNNGDMSREGA